MMVKSLADIVACAVCGSIISVTLRYNWRLAAGLFTMLLFSVLVGILRQIKETQEDEQ